MISTLFYRVKVAKSIEADNRTYFVEVEKIHGLFHSNVAICQVRVVYVDQMVALGCMPVHDMVPVDKGLDGWGNFGTKYFLECREIGILNIVDGSGTITAGGDTFHLGVKGCLYII